MGRGLLVGLVLGFAAGWVVFVTLGAPPPPDAGAPEPVTAVEGAHGVAPPAPAHLAGNPPPPASSTAPPVDVGAAERRLDAAASGGDWLDTYDALRALGEADTPEADRVLVRMLGDASVRFPEPMGTAFRVWLAGSTVEGIPEAVRRRVDVDAQTFGLDREVVLRDWTILLAEHGGEADLAWILDVGGDELFDHAYERMMASRPPQALDLARRIVETRHLDPESRPLRARPRLLAAVTALVAKDPDWIRPVLVEETERIGRGSILAVDASTSLTLYAKTLCESDLEAGYSLILDTFHKWGTRDPLIIRAAFSAAATLAEAGHDVAPLSEILARLAEHVLDAVAGRAPDTKDNAWTTAPSLLVTQELAWTDQAVPAMEAALPYVPGPERLGLLRAIQEARRHRR